jgi:hypothetical protein
MRKFIPLFGMFAAVVTVTIISFSCAEDDYNSEYDCHLSLNAGEALDSPVNADVIREAIRRMDSYVSFRRGEFYADRATPDRLHMSEDLFNVLLSMMRQTNDMLDEMTQNSRLVEIKPNVVKVVDKEVPLLLLQTRGLGEDALSPGSSGWDARWYGIDVYLSPRDLEAIALFAQGTSFVAGGAALLAAAGYITAGLAIPAGFAALAGEGIALAAAAAGFVCDNGIVVETTYLGSIARYRCQ